MGETSVFWFFGLTVGIALKETYIIILFSGNLRLAMRKVEIWKSMNDFYFMGVLSSKQWDSVDIKGWDWLPQPL